MDKNLILYLYQAYWAQIRASKIFFQKSGFVSH